MNPVRVAIVGCGNVLSAYWAECQKLAARGEAVVVAACGRPAQRDLVVDRLGVRRFVTDHRELVEAPDVDLVVVLTPAPTHFEITRAALLAGKHVLAEKPLATTLAEADELVELAARGPGLLMPAPFTPLSPTYRAIADRIRRGDTGRPCLARGRYGWSGPWWGEWFYRPGGGPVFDLACYNVTSLTGWLGPVERVTAMTGAAIPERLVNGKPLPVGVEDTAQVLLDFGGACFGVVTSGFTMQQYRSPALEVYGTEGTVQMLGDDWDPDGYELWRNAAGCWQVFKETQPDWPWADGLRHLVECVRTGAKPVVTPEHARHVLEVMLAAHESGRDGAAKVVRSRFDPPAVGGPDPDEAAHRVHDRTRQEFGG
ncbi:MAG: Gfo/Idh/MocA family oxidoreductase [Gemmataceae bacterium]|nr:Gfo/Idh/MocA family oxidoreductase [Gemmataceae bacterium]